MPCARFDVFAYHRADWKRRSCLNDLARHTTRAASLHTFYTIALLVKAPRQKDAYRAYAYFRWVDDWLDASARQAADRLTFVRRQNDLVERAYRGACPARASAEEQLLIDLIRSDANPSSSLAAYIRNMMSVMAFDAVRRGRLITQAELAAYQRSLAVAVTEAVYYFMDAEDAAPRTPQTYLGVTAAHITHMLRDTHDDLAAGYYNVPVEILRQNGIGPQDVHSPAYRNWVRMRAEQAREYFWLGRRYLESCRSTRCRLAAHSYAARFESVLDRIEADGFRLRADYGVCQTLRASLGAAASALVSTLGIHPVTRTFGVARGNR